MRVIHTDTAVTIQLRSATTLALAAGALTTVPNTGAGELLRGVLAYLAAMEARELERAAAMLGKGFVMRFPGAAEFRALPELLSWAAARYRRVSKRVAGLDAVGSLALGTVYCRGWLDGEWPDGSPFRGVRFIDRFEIVDGLLHSQEVWNDLGESRAPGAGVPSGEAHAC
jgi:hypothetical protein